MILAGLAACCAIAPRQIDEYVARGDWFGYRTANVGDIDGDEVPDCIVGNPFSWSPGGRNRAWVFSGADGRVLHEIAGPLQREHETMWRDVEGRFASGVRGAGDVDADGVPDLLVFVPANALLVLSGRSCERLFEFPCPRGDAHLLGTARPFVALGDVDGDGHDDVASGMFVRSGADGSILAELDLPTVQPGEVLGLYAVGDVDGDDRGDLAAAASSRAPGRVVLLSGRSGRRILEWTEGRDDSARGTTTGIRSAGSSFGFDVASGGDFDCDGHPDLVIVSRGDAHVPASVRLVSVVTGVTVANWSPRSTFHGDVSCVGPDVDGDGHPEVGTLGCSGLADIELRSTCDGRARWSSTLDADEPWDAWGKLASVERAGDVDRDGVEDLLVSVLQDASPGLPGYVLLLSGRDGRRLRVYDTPSSLRKVGKPR